MEEYAPMMKEPVGSVAHANRNILVNVVKMIDVIFMNVKMEGLVLSILSTIFQHQDANVPKLITAQSAIWRLVVYVVIMTIFVMAILVTVFKKMELQNITVKVVICQLLAMVIHVRIVGRVRQLSKVKFRHVLKRILSYDKIYSRAISVMYFLLNFEAKSNPQNHVNPTKFDLLWKPCNQLDIQSTSINAQQ